MRTFTSAILLSTGLLVSLSATAEGVCKTVQPKAEDIKANFHANYLPNLIPALVNSEAALSLTTEQCQIFNQYRQETAAKGKEAIAQIAQLEKQSMQAALAGASNEDIMQRHQKIAELRQKIVVGKMKCHEFVKSQLTASQYEKLVNEVYPKLQAMAAQKASS